MFERFALLISILMIAGAVWAGLMAVLIAHAILHPPRMNDGRAIVRLRRLSPADLEIEFEDIEFSVLDAAGPGRLKIAGWWMPAGPSTGRTAVLLHGYADAKVGGVAWAPVLLACGLNVLAIDLRAHGDSGGSKCTAGFFEKSDVSQVIDQFRQSHPAQTQQVVLFGASMGSAVAAAVAAERDDIAAVVLDSPYVDFRGAMAVRAAQRGLPTGWLLRAGALLAERWAKIRYDDVRPVDLIAALRCPVMVILPGADALIDDAERAELTRAVLAAKSAMPGDVYAPPGIGHLQAFTADPQTYADRLGRFLTEALRPRETVPA